MRIHDLADKNTEIPGKKRCASLEQALLVGRVRRLFAAGHYVALQVRT